MEKMYEKICKLINENCNRIFIDEENVYGGKDFLYNEQNTGYHRLDDSYMYSKEEIIKKQFLPINNYALFYEEQLELEFNPNEENIIIDDDVWDIRIHFVNYNGNKDEFFRGLDNYRENKIACDIEIDNYDFSLECYNIAKEKDILILG